MSGDIARFIGEAGERLGRENGVSRHAGRFVREETVYGYATDGVILVARPLSDWSESQLFPESLGVPAPLILWNEKASESWQGSFETEALRQWCGNEVWDFDCPRCRGTGFHECACGNTHDCSACGGDGELPAPAGRPRPGYIGVVVVDRVLLGKTLDLLSPPSRVSVSSGEGYAGKSTAGVRIVAGAGVAVIAAMQADDRYVHVATFGMPEERT